MAQLKDTAINGRLAVDGNIILKDGSKLFYEAGDSIDFSNNNSVNTAGWIDSHGNLIFTIPITRPVLGTPTATATSVSGFVVRQNGVGIYGSTPESYVMPLRCVVTKSYNTGFIITAYFQNQSGITLNAPAAVHWSGTITLS